MRRPQILLLALLLAATACGGDSDDGPSGDGGDSDNGGTTSSNTDSDGFDSGFGESDLPAGFPGELIPPSYSSGAILENAGQEIVAFRSGLTFDDAVAHYTDILGEGLVIEAGDRQAMWLDGPGWALALFGEDPLEITMTRNDG